MPDQIFISYRRDDAAYVTGHINDILRREFGHESVFTDVDNIALGVDFRTVLDESVAQCQVFLAVVGDNWLSVRDQEGRQRLTDPGDFVRIEIESALRRNIPIIPLLVGSATMPQAEELPETLKDFAFRNGTQIRPPPDFNADMERLIRSLRSYLESLRQGGQKDDTKPAETPAKEAAPLKPERRSKARQKISVGADETARKSAELGIGEHAPKKRWGVRLLVLTILAAGAGGWYYNQQNPGVLESLLGTTAPVVDAAPAIEEEAPAPVSDDSTAEVTSEEEAVGAVAIDSAEDAASPAEMEPDLAAVSDSADVADDAIVEADAETADTEATADESATETGSVVDDEIVLTPGTRRQADAASFIREGVSLAAIGDHAGAIAYFDQVIELGVEPAFAYRNRGASYQALEQFEAAVSDYDEAISLNSEDVIAYYNRGVSHFALENYTAAVADYDSVIQLDPEYVDAYSKRADAHEALGNTAEAARDRATAGVFESNRNR